MEYYTYKITFKDLPSYFYYGFHKDNGKPYLGSPVTWAHLWDQFEPEIQILCWCETHEEAQKIEQSIIQATWNSPYSLNENCGGAISSESCAKGGKTTWDRHDKKMRDNSRRIGEDNVRLKRGFWKDGMLEKKRETGLRHKQNRIGIFHPEVIGKGGRRAHELKKGIHDPANKEKCREGSRKSGKEQGPKAARKLMEEGRGIHDPNLQHLKKEWAAIGGRAGGKKSLEKINKQRWMNTDDRFPPYVSTPAGLTNWQKSRGIDVSKRKRID